MKRSSNFLYLLALLSVLSCTDSREVFLGPELAALDALLDRTDDFVQMKEHKIASLRSLLDAEDVSDHQKYTIYGQLYREYEAFHFDSAFAMLEKQESLASGIGDRHMITDVNLEKARLLSDAGLYLEATNVLDKIDTTVLDYQQKISWYGIMQKFLRDYNDYVGSLGVVVPGVENIRVYQDLIFHNTTADSPINQNIRVQRLIEAQDYEAAYEENKQILTALKRDSREYATQTYWQGFICEQMGADRIEECIRWWIESASVDISQAIKDNASLCSIAIKLMDLGDTDRAFRYIKSSLEDANFFNTKLRRVQVASSFPLIERAYSDRVDRQMKERSYFSFAIAVVALLLLLTCIVLWYFILRDRKSAIAVESKDMQLAEYLEEIHRSAEDLQRSNSQLVEANAAKEEYLGLYLSMCSGYLDKLKKALPRELYEQELKNFYKTFDSSFISLYPNFVEEFNALLKEDERVVLKDGEALNTELRIFALIKLGITQSSHIASLLRYSVNTIYNYRSQVKNAALEDRENFENDVRKIGSSY